MIAETSSPELCGRVLLVDDEETFRLSTAALLAKSGYLCDVASDAGEAIERMQEQYDVVIADLRMKGNHELEFLTELRNRWPTVPVLVITGYPSVQTAVQSLRLATLDYLIKPVEFDDLLGAVRRGVAKRQSIQTLVNASQTAKSVDEAIEQMEHTLIHQSGNTVNKELFWSLDRYILQVVCHIAQLTWALKKTIVQITEAPGMEQVDVCQAMQCPRLQVYRQTLENSVAVLEKTKHAFKSKDLAELRKDIELVLQRDR